MNLRTTILLNAQSARSEERTAGLLVRSGFSVCPCHSEAEVWDSLRSEPVDLVLINADQVAQELINRIAQIHAVCADLPILLLVPDLSLGDLAKIVNAGVSAYLLKPVGSAQMVSAIHTLLNPHHPPLDQEMLPPGLPSFPKR